MLDHRPGSVAIFVSYEPPAGRLPFLQARAPVHVIFMYQTAVAVRAKKMLCFVPRKQSDEWQWTVEAEEDEQGNYVYFCTRV